MTDPLTLALLGFVQAVFLVWFKHYLDKRPALGKSMPFLDRSILWPLFIGVVYMVLRWMVEDINHTLFPPGNKVFPEPNYPGEWFVRQWFLSVPIGEGRLAVHLSIIPPFILLLLSNFAFMLCGYRLLVKIIDWINRQS